MVAKMKNGYYNKIYFKKEVFMKNFTLFQKILSRTELCSNSGCLYQKHANHLSVKSAFRILNSALLRRER